MFQNCRNLQRGQLIRRKHKGVAYLVKEAVGSSCPLLQLILRILSVHYNLDRIIQFHIMLESYTKQYSCYACFRLNWEKYVLLFNNSSIYSRKLKIEYFNLAHLFSINSHLLDHLLVHGVSSTPQPKNRGEGKGEKGVGEREGGRKRGGRKEGRKAGR